MPDFYNKEFADSMRKAEDFLLSEAFISCSSSPVFILGAPRTGSTILYQAMINYIGLPFISNLTNNCFSETPIVGFAVQNHALVDVGWESQFGKTDGIFHPSEASALMSNWFGGRHPSQAESTKILDGREVHFLSTLAAAEKISGGRPLLIKNAWNCFRVHYLANTLPEARFVWIRRDIIDAAESDLEARYLTKHSLNRWNSATPANVAELQKLPPYQQVVENQYEFNQAISKSLSSYASGQSVELWYEDFTCDPEIVLRKIAQFIGYDMKEVDKNGIRKFNKKRQINEEESDAIGKYVSENSRRFRGHCYPPSGKDS